MSANQKNPNPMEPLQTRFRDVGFQIQQLHARFETWRSKQPIAVETAVATAIGAALGAVLCSAQGRMSTVPVVRFGLDAAQPGVPLIFVRNYAVLGGIYNFIGTVMERVRGKQDVQSCMVSAVGCAAVCSMLTAASCVPNGQTAPAIAEGIAFGVLAFLVSIR